MRVLVTGHRGFIGSKVQAFLEASGHEVVGIDVRDPSTPGDVRDPDVWDRAIGSGVDAVCHQAAMVGLGVDFSDVRAYVDANDVGTAVGLSVLAGRRFRGRFVLASSMVVYGEGRYRCAVHGDVRPAPRTADDLDAGRFEPPCPECGARVEWQHVTEDAPTDPRNVYAATKLHQEHLCASWARECGGSFVALRYHNVYGPGMPPDTPYAGVAAIFKSAIARGEAPRVFEDGGQTRDFVHVDDVARANLAALSVDSVSGPYNVASGEPRTVVEMATALAASALPARAPLVVGGGRTGDVRHVVASPARAAADLGFRATISFVDGMRAFASDPLGRRATDAPGMAGSASVNANRH